MGIEFLAGPGLGRLESSSKKGLAVFEFVFALGFLVSWFRALAFGVEAFLGKLCRRAAFSAVTRLVWALGLYPHVAFRMFAAQSTVPGAFGPCGEPSRRGVLGIQLNLQSLYA